MITATEIAIVNAIASIQATSSDGRRRGAVGQRDRREVEREDGSSPRNQSKLDQIWDR